MKVKSLLLSCLLIPCSILAQNLPLEVKLTQDGRLTYGGNPTTGFYNPEHVHKLEITLTQSNWFQTLDGTSGPNGTPAQSLIGKLTFNDTLVLDSVYVSIKGQTSDSRNNSEKKSFKIEIDEIIEQDLLGYDNLNLNCAFQDHSSMREVLYYDVTRAFAPALKGSFVDLYINGQYWGPYNNIQQIEGRYIKEWFLDNDGTRWRADAPEGTGGMGGPGGGNRFGKGESTLNYNGPDSSDYNENYTLKKSVQDNPWQDLIDACYELNNLPIAQLYDSLKYVLDVDRALWFLAQEMVFVDDDSYINKGGMDYYVYWDITTDRIIPMEVDGNSVMASNHITWSPFYNEDDADFPLMNRLLQNTELRQRYLAHLRTVLSLHFTETEVHKRIDEFAAILDQRVQDDPKKLYSYTQFQAGVQSLKSLVTTRISNLESNSEISRDGVGISDLVMTSSSGVGMAPKANETASISVKITGDAQKVVLYYGLGLDGVFERMEMLDDGSHGDGQANDNVYGGEIPGFSPGNYVRYYVEAIKDDAYSTASFYPEGAEHDVFIYQVEQGLISSDDVVINEFMADNETSVSDQSGEFDDWIELYNNGSTKVDLEGYHLTDDASELDKWEFPADAKIWPGGYLIIWADDDEDQSVNGELHASFKLSAGGEEILLVNPSGQVIDTVYFGEQVEDKSYARKPNGTGSFEIRDATFNANNDNGNAGIKELTQSVRIYPNPSHGYLIVEADNVADNTLYFNLLNSVGQQVLSSQIESGTRISTSHLRTGIYHAIIRDKEHNTTEVHKVIIAN